MLLSMACGDRPRKNPGAPNYHNSQTQKTMNLFDNLKKKAWALIKHKAVEILVAMLTAAITSLTTTSCMGYGPM